jgi:hypothetical protein
MLFEGKKDGTERLEKIVYRGSFDFYFLRYIIRVIKSRRVRWMGHVARMGEKGNTCRVGGYT